jgi:hypothetical protein
MEAVHYPLDVVTVECLKVAPNELFFLCHLAVSFAISPTRSGHQAAIIRQWICTASASLHTQRFAPPGSQPAQRDRAQRTAEHVRKQLGIPCPDFAAGLPGRDSGAPTA